MGHGNPKTSTSHIEHQIWSSSCYVSNLGMDAIVKHLQRLALLRQVQGTHRASRFIHLPGARSRARGIKKGKRTGEF